MRLELVPDQDALFRHCVFPESFKSSQKRFAREKLFKLYERQGGACLAASVTWQRCHPTMFQLHRSGCRLAESRNRNSRGQAARKVYCGAYQFYALSLADVIGLDNVADAYAIHDPENGEFAHVSLVFILRGDPLFSLSDTKTAILDRLWNATYGPLRHVCRCDGSLASHPSGLLEDAPLGPYRERRSFFRRAWDVPSSMVFGFWWRKFSKPTPERDECPDRAGR
jgi:hypothetical protein